MARPPRPNQRSYRGRIRADIRAVQRHLGKLLAWDARYRAAALATYPNQLAPIAQINSVANVQTIILAWLSQLGPIPSR